MNINKKATSIVEAIVLMMIIVTGVTWMYKIYMSSIWLEQWIKNKIIAINIAREWIEAMTNIRNTNWILFLSDTKDCWNTENYQNSCVQDINLTTTDIDGTYKIYKNDLNRWQLDKSINLWTYESSADFRNEHRVWLDNNWFYTQSWIIKDLIPLFTRKIVVSYETDSNDEKMEVKSIVEWFDNSSSATHKIELTKILTNWKE